MSDLGLMERRATPRGERGGAGRKRNWGRVLNPLLVLYSSGYSQARGCVGRPGLGCDGPYWVLKDSFSSTRLPEGTSHGHEYSGVSALSPVPVVAFGWKWAFLANLSADILGQSNHIHVTIQNGANGAISLAIALPPKLGLPFHRIHGGPNPMVGTGWSMYLPRMPAV